jgi:hypothetical protein
MAFAGLLATCLPTNAGRATAPDDQLQPPFQELSVGNWVNLQYLQLFNLLKVWAFPEQLYRGR